MMPSAASWAPTGCADKSRRLLPRCTRAPRAASACPAIPQRSISVPSLPSTTGPGPTHRIRVLLHNAIVQVQQALPGGRHNLAHHAKVIEDEVACAVDGNVAGVRVCARQRGGRGSLRITKQTYETRIL